MVGRTGHGSVTEGDLLVRFAEAVHSGDDLDVVRDQLIDRLGPAAMIDAAAVCANFNMMVRIADGTGTPLDEGTATATDEMRDRLGLDDLTSRRVARS
ncbi:MAG: hypothetical protein AAGD35_08965 [Actinomycetota bacterium]